MTYTIHRYPVHLIDVVQLADATRVTIRPVLPQDAELQQAFVRELSDAARYARFMTRLGELPDAMAERFSCIDYRNHFALLAEVFDAGREQMIAEARYVVEEKDPDACEFALAIGDQWRRSGIARSLLDRLERNAAAAGLKRMTASTLANNQAMIGLARRTGYAVKYDREDARLVRLEKWLTGGTVQQFSTAA